VTSSAKRPPTLTLVLAWIGLWQLLVPAARRAATWRPMAG
jgi:hypothetical protein